MINTQKESICFFVGQPWLWRHRYPVCPVAVRSLSWFPPGSPRRGPAASPGTSPRRALGTPWCGGPVETTMRSGSSSYLIVSYKISYAASYLRRDGLFWWQGVLPISGGVTYLTVTQILRGLIYLKGCYISRGALPCPRGPPYFTDLTCSLCNIVFRFSCVTLRLYV